MIALAVLVTQVPTQSGNGKADARLASGLQASLAVYRRDVALAKVAATKLGKGVTLGNALGSGNRSQVQSAARSLAQRYHVRGLVIRDAAGRSLAVVGVRNPTP